MDWFKIKHGLLNVMFYLLARALKNKWKIDGISLYRVRKHCGVDRHLFELNRLRMTLRIQPAMRRSGAKTKPGFRWLERFATGDTPRLFIAR